MEFTNDILRGTWPPGWRANIGFIMPLAIPGCLYEYEIIFPEGVSIIYVPLSLQMTTPEGVSALSQEAIAVAPKLRLADVIIYNCFSGAALMGSAHDREVISAIESTTGKKTTSMATACVEALRALGATKITIVSPYIRELVEAEIDYFVDQGFYIAYEESLNISTPLDIFRRSPSQNYDFAVSVHNSAQIKQINSDVLFIACGAMQFIEFIDDLEKVTGLPVLSSTIASAWMCLKLADIHEPIKGYGKLLAQPR